MNSFFAALTCMTGQWNMPQSQSAHLMRTLRYLQHVQVDEGEILHIVAVVSCVNRRRQSPNAYHRSGSDENPHRLAAFSCNFDERPAGVHCRKDLRFNTVELSVFDGMERFVDIHEKGHICIRVEE